MFAIDVNQAVELAGRALQEGRLQQAEMLCLQILAQQPQHAEALHLLGAIAYQVGQTGAAVGLLRQAVAAEPGAGVYRGNLAEALRVSGKVEDALPEVREALR